mmetsp:Transcript_109/g.318  ORF Transcript_109/g.318 Transcript_109/m.318 type:complete len:648 (+) Transcript_109:36-1979(+)
MPLLSKPTALAGVSGLAILALYIRQRGDTLSRRVGGQKFFAHTESSKRSRVAVDSAFLRRLWKLLKIVMPGLLTPEAGFAATVSVMMVARTLCDLWMLKTSTTIEAAIIGRDKTAFFKHLGRFLVGTMPIALINNLLKYSLVELSIRFRERLTKHLFAEYLRGFTYYKISNLDNRIANPDQLMTQDVERFCQSLTDLYSNISKPVLDIIVYFYKLSGSIGAAGPTLMMAYLAVSGVLLTWLRRPTGRFTVNEQKLEGEFRFVNSRLITNSEEIAFYKGNEREARVVNDTFRRLIRMVRRAQQFRFSIGVVDSIVAKYVATVVGYVLVSRPFLDSSNTSLRGLSRSELMTSYYRSGRMLLNMASAIGRLVLAGRELTRLAGFTSRVTELVGVLKDLNEGTYRRTMVSTPGRPRMSLVPGAGRIEYQDHLIKFEGCPLVTPNGDVLVESLSFEVPSGRNVLVAGPNGCGKSSAFRILGELWPLFGGRLTKPEPAKLFYIPQRPYLALGTLRDQVIYPDTEERMRAKGFTDADLMGLLEEVRLEYLVDREGGWESVQDWADVLSGGEKQRVAMARVFYHRPQFAILDECTSAVSVDVEGHMYNRCRELNITLFTVSHRKSLWKFHEFVLQFDGKGNYSYMPREEATEFGS